MNNLPQSNRFPVTAILVASAAGVACVYVVGLTGAVDFRLFFGIVPPIVAVILVCVAGLGALYSLHKYQGFSVYRETTIRQGVLSAAALAVPFMVAVTTADVVLRFPADINVALPSAALFYPAMGFLAQLALHIVPFALLLLLVSFLLPNARPNWRLGACILLASLPEAAFQVTGSLSNGGLTAIDAFVAVHLLLFGIAELYLYRRFDYATMYAFRILYYSYWHVVWGNLRLSWLF